MSTECTPVLSREVVARYPHIPRSKLLLRDAPHLAQRGILIGMGYSLKLGIFRVLAGIGMRHVGGRFEVNSQ